jgi:hypothetical protein
MDRIAGGDVVIRIIADSSKAEAEVDKLKNTVAAKSSQMASYMQSAMNIMFGASALAAIIKFIASVVKAGDALYDMSRRFDISVENLSRLKYAADQSGVSVDEIATAIKFLSKNVVEANSGNANLQKAFDTLGVHVRDANGQFKDGHTLLLETVDALSRVENNAQQVALATELMGRSGDTILQISEDISALEAEADALGITMSTSAASAANEFFDALGRLFSIAKNNRFITYALPYWTKAIDEFGGRMRDAGTNIKKAFDFIGELWVNLTTGPVNKVKFTAQDFWGDAARYGPPIDLMNDKIKQHGNQWEKTGHQAADAAKEIAKTLALWDRERTGLAPGQAGPGRDLIQPLQPGAYEFGPSSDLMTDVRTPGELTPFDVMDMSAGLDEVMPKLMNLTGIYMELNNLMQEGIMLEQEKAQAAHESASAVISGLGYIADGMSAMAGNSRGMFIFQQMLSIAQMVIDAAAGWAKATAQGGMAGFAIGAGIFAKIMALIATVRSQKPPAEPRMRIPGAAEGGIAMKPQVVAVAEYGRPEIIAPLDKFEKMVRRGQQGMTVRVADKPAFLRALAFELKSVMAEENL